MSTKHKLPIRPNPPSPSAPLQGWEKTVTKAIAEVDKQAEAMDSKNTKREETEAELINDKEPGGVLAWDRSTKHTPTPWVADRRNGFHSINDAEEGSCVAHVFDVMEGDGGYSNARLIPASVNSYAKHCKDPVAAAESDLLGRALKWIQEVGNLTYIEDIELREAILAETKEGA